MSQSSQQLVQFEVTGRDSDRELVRSLARRLADDGPESDRLRRVVAQSIADGPGTKGNILNALRNSPLVDADLNLTRPREDGRKAAL